MGFFSTLFGRNSKTSLADVLKSGAQIIDVRTPEEFRTGHGKKAINLPLQNLKNNLSKIDKNKAVVTCCASGIRSASAKRILESAGFTQVYNGGSWRNVQSKSEQQ